VRTTGKSLTSLEDLPRLRSAAVHRLLISRINDASNDVERIIASAYRVIERQPDFELKMRDIVDEAGISTQSFYKLFGSKDEFILILLEHGQVVFERKLSIALERAASPLERITIWIEEVLDQAVDERIAEHIRPFLVHIPRLTATRPADIEATRATVLEPLTAAVEQATSDASTAHLYADLIYHTAFSYMHMFVLERRRPSDDERRGLVDYCLRAIGLDTAVGSASRSSRGKTSR